MREMLLFLAAVVIPTTAASEENYVRKCTDRKEVLITNQDCPKGWIECVGRCQGDIRKIKFPSASEAQAENKKLEAELQRMEAEPRKSQKP